MKRIFSNLSEAEFDNLFKKYNYNGNRVIELFAYICLKELGSTQKFRSFVKDIKFEGDFSKAILFPQEILEQLSKNYKLYILSNSSVDNIHFVSGKIGLNLSFFTKIYDNQFKEDDLTKARALKDIIKESEIEPNKFLMVGDSIEYDLLPAKKMGMKVLLVE